MELMVRIFRNIIHNTLLGDFTVNLGTSTTAHAELCWGCVCNQTHL